MPLTTRRSSKVVWVEPTLIAEVEFRGWTGDGILRHASYKGLLEGADMGGVFRRSKRRNSCHNPWHDSLKAVPATPGSARRVS